MSQLPPEVYGLIDAALSEDQTFNDPTTATLVPPEIQGHGMIRAKAPGVLAGIDVTVAVFQRVDPELETRVLLPDGSPLTPGSDIARVQGSAGSILRAERIALNFLQRMSGVATDTNQYVRAVQGCKARIVDTRKTVPGRRFGPDKPVYVLTSDRTFSGAEEFAYNLQTRKRATIVGDTTGGGAHPGGMRRVTDHFGVWVPSGRAINPITKTNWERVGVRPDIAVAADQAHIQAVVLPRVVEQPDHLRDAGLRAECAAVVDHPYLP